MRKTKAEIILIFVLKTIRLLVAGTTSTYCHYNILIKIACWSMGASRCMCLEWGSLVIWCMIRMHTPTIVVIKQWNRSVCQLGGRVASLGMGVPGVLKKWDEWIDLAEIMANCWFLSGGEKKEKGFYFNDKKAVVYCMQSSTVVSVCQREGALCKANFPTPIKI